MELGQHDAWPRGRVLARGFGLPYYRAGGYSTPYRYDFGAGVGCRCHPGTDIPVDFSPTDEGFHGDPEMLREDLVSSDLVLSTIDAIEANIRDADIPLAFESGLAGVFKFWVSSVDEAYSSL